VEDTAVSAKTEKISAYWFASGSKLLHNDNRPIIVGKKHSLRGPIVICVHALHASRDPFDALCYAPGPYLYKVLVWGDVVEHADKLGSRNREYVAMRDATDMLRQFAREQALSVIHFWDAPNVVRKYLETGDEKLRAAAAAAAHAASYASAAYAHVAAASAACTTAAVVAAHATAAAVYAASAAAAHAASSAVAAHAAASVADTVAAASAAARKRFIELVEELFQGAA
jgi:hypothetical protein